LDITEKDAEIANLNEMMNVLNEKLANTTNELNNLIRENTEKDAEIAKLNEMMNVLNEKLANTTNELNNLIRENNENPCGIEQENALTKTALNTLTSGPLQSNTETALTSAASDILAIFLFSLLFPFYLKIRRQIIDTYGEIYIKRNCRRVNHIATLYEDIQKIANTIGILCISLVLQGKLVITNYLQPFLFSFFDFLRTNEKLNNKIFKVLRRLNSSAITCLPYFSCF